MHTADHLPEYCRLLVTRMGDGWGLYDVNGALIFAFSKPGLDWARSHLLIWEKRLVGRMLPSGAYPVSMPGGWHQPRLDRNAVIRNRRFRDAMWKRGL